MWKILSLVPICIFCVGLGDLQEKSEVDLPDGNEETLNLPTSQPKPESPVPAAVNLPHKRESRSTRRRRAEGQTFSLPVILPPPNATELDDTKRCILYFEGMYVILWNKQGGNPTFHHAVIGNSLNSSDKYTYATDSVQCIPSGVYAGDARFKIVYNLMQDVKSSQAVFTVRAGEIEIDLTFTRDIRGYWGISAVNIIKLTIDFTDETCSNTPINGLINDTANLDNLGVQSWHGYGYACSQTHAAFISGNTDCAVGIGFTNIQVELNATRRDNMLIFNRNVADCIGTFSVGSWMGIVCSLVLASILMFGYLMLQSVQTMDRFDDPKQKQIVINFKE